MTVDTMLKIMSQLDPVEDKELLEFYEDKYQEILNNAWNEALKIHGVKS